MGRNVLVVMEESTGRGTYPDVFCRVIDTDSGKVSPVYRLHNEPRPHGNPYLVFGPLVEQFVGTPKLSCNITVAEICSGNLKQHFVEEAAAP